MSKNLNSTGIVVPLSLECYGKGYALVMPEEGAISLDKVVAKEHFLDLGNCLDIAIQLAEILQELDRQQVIHKDIKPANILIQPETQKVKLIDFSIASLLPREAQEIKNFNVLEGTLAYISPEQTGRMNRGIDYRSDFYSLGVTLYQLLTGTLPFSSNDPMELVHCHISQPPIPPAEVENNVSKIEIPPVVSELVMKLMAKNAEERYQSALGLKFDLENCLKQWQERGEIEAFDLASRDIAGRFLIPEKLYGREAEVETLLAAFERVAQGQTEIMLVAGFSGIGKTAVVHEVHKPIVRQRGYFIKGKFDQFNRNIPFSAFVQAFRDLMQQLLAESDAQVAQWQSAILAALGENGQVIIEVIPELELLIGKQPSVPELSGNAAQNRFNLLFQKFIQVFTTPEHPLVIFLDDLQWSDSGSLQLIQLLMGESETGYLLLLGAYRDNEVYPAHPLRLTLEEIVKSGAIINTITLAPLRGVDLNGLVADTLSCSQELAWLLTKLVYQKTKGNPFFATQFIKGLHEDGLIAFDRDQGYWHCDLTEVRQLALTEDVVEFMASRLHKLPVATQEILKLASCIGDRFDLQTLAIVSELEQMEVATSLWGALQEGLVLPLGQTYKFFQEANRDERMPNEEISVSYKFLHDRVQQAAYSLIPEDRKQLTHYHIGQLLLQQIPPEERAEKIFDLVGQLNYGIDLIADQKQRDELAQLNLIAGKKAKDSTAYVAANNYLTTGLSLLAGNSWQSQYILTLHLHEAAAEAAYFNGSYEKTDSLVEVVVKNAKSLPEKARVYEIQMQMNLGRNKMQEAIDIGLKVLNLLDIELVDTLSENRSLEYFQNLPTMTDPAQLAGMRILGGLWSAAYIANPALMPKVITTMVQLASEGGNSPQSAFGYSLYGMLLSGGQVDIERGYQFGQTGLRILEQFADIQFSSKVCLLFNVFTRHWKDYPGMAIPALQQGIEMGLEAGDIEYACYCALSSCFIPFLIGENLQNLRPRQQAYMTFVGQMKQDFQFNGTKIWGQILLNFLGEFKQSPELLVGELFDEREMFPVFKRTQNFTLLFWANFGKAMLAYLLGNYDGALTYSREAKQYEATVAGMFCVARNDFYYILSILADLDNLKGEDEKVRGLEQIQASQDNLKLWVKHCPGNFQHNDTLIEAEKSRRLKDYAGAIALYDRAIAGAKENEYIQEEALANELAAKFYLDWDKEKIAQVYMTDAYYCYARWGAKAKTDQLEEKYPQLLSAILQQPRLQFPSGQTLTNTLTQTAGSTSSTTSSMLDWATAMKASQSLSSEMHLDKLVSTLMKAAMENAGADGAILLLQQPESWQFVARCSRENCDLYSNQVADETALPTSIINKVKHSQEAIIINDFSCDTQFAGDPYLLQEQPKSFLCVPILNQGKLIGILYLENHLAVGAFTSDRVEVLSMLCSQAAISLENARLYEQAQQALKDLQEAQLQLVQSEKMSALGNLVAGVAHEINNPVGFIAGNIEPARDYLEDLLGLLDLYQQEYPQPSEAIEEEIEAIDLEFLTEDLPQLITSMQEGTDRIRHISNSLRTFSRTDKEYKVPFNLHEGLDSTLLILKHRLKANEERPAIEIVKDYGELPEVQCFPGQLNQVFMNLMANAIDALDEGNQGCSFDEIANQIKITTSATVEKVIVTIADNGMGMPEEVRERIFEQGFTTKAVGKGTGLGMAIAQSIIAQKHGGKITCTSQLGKGTQLEISIPIGN
nr:AAA family ATPase [Roseofilum sp. Guam]